jgi:hypothetical protein
MDGIPTLFTVVFVTIFVLAIVSFGFSFFRTLKFSRKVFDHVEDHLDRQIAKSAPPEETRCEFCGGHIEDAKSCPNCGAPAG